ncbi:MAG TPA: RNA polymerase sigma factor [Verrucomicrobiae bacterium]
MEDTGHLHDDLLVLQCQQGDVAGFDGLVRRWQQPLLNYAYRLTGNWAAAQDVVQETWLVVIRGLVTLKDVTRFRAWLFRVASHKCQDHWRRNATQERFVEAVQQQAETAAAGEPPNAQRADIDAAFRRLPPESRTVLALMYLEDFSVGEIADVLSLPDGTVKSRLFHARQQLRQIMEKDYGPH